MNRELQGTNKQKYGKIWVTMIKQYHAMLEYVWFLKIQTELPPLPLGVGFFYRDAIEIGAFKCYKKITSRDRKRNCILKDLWLKLFFLKTICSGSSI